MILSRMHLPDAELMRDSSGLLGMVFTGMLLSVVQIL